MFRERLKKISEKALDGVSAWRLTTCHMITFFDAPKPEIQTPQPSAPAPEPKPAVFKGKVRDWTEEELKDAMRVNGSRGGKHKKKKTAEIPAAVAPN